MQAGLLCRARSIGHLLRLPYENVVVRNCHKITFNLACLFLRQHIPKISYIARYAPDFWDVLSKKNPAQYLKVIL